MPKLFPGGGVHYPVFSTGKTIVHVPSQENIQSITLLGGGEWLKIW